MHLASRIVLAVSSAAIGLVAQAMFANRIEPYHPELLVVAAAAILLVAADIPELVRAKPTAEQSEQISTTPWVVINGDAKSHVVEQKGETIRLRFGSMFAQRIRLRSQTSGNCSAPQGWSTGNVSPAVST